MDVYLSEIKERLSIFKNMYSHIRIVEPIEKKSHSESNDRLITELVKEHCYKFWETSRQCENCISMRAINTMKSVVKIEIKDKTTYLIQAFPVQIREKYFVIEMLRDITDDEIVLVENQENKNLHEYVKEINTQLITDKLTKLYNRRYIEERLPVDLYKAKLEGKSVSIVMADIDHFKNVNDTYGHVVGDCILSELAILIKDSIRESTDWLARYGGEEFIIVLNNSNKNKALAIVEKIRKK